MPLDTLSFLASSSKLRVLTLGSGDGSQQISLAQCGRCDLTVSFYDNHKTLLTKYKRAEANIHVLQQLGAQVLFGIDATKLYEHTALGLFDVVSFYFPHTGVSRHPLMDPFLTKREKKELRRRQEEAHVNSQRGLISGFLKAVPCVLKKNGEVHLAVMAKKPYETWGVDDIISSSNFLRKDWFRFQRKVFPGYVHVQTTCDEMVDDAQAVVHILTLRAPVATGTLDSAQRAVIRVGYSIAELESSIQSLLVESDIGASEKASNAMLPQKTSISKLPSIVDTLHSVAMSCKIVGDLIDQHYPLQISRQDMMPTRSQNAQQIPKRRCSENGESHRKCNRRSCEDIPGVQSTVLLSSDKGTH